MNERFVVIKTTEGPGAKIIIYRKKQTLQVEYDPFISFLFIIYFTIRKEMKFILLEKDTRN